MVHSTTGRPVTDMEREIQAEIRNRPPLHEPQFTDIDAPTVGAPALAMPDYVEHRDGATEIGKLSAEAIAREYEVAAKEIEATRTELIERAKQCETMIRDTLAVADEIKEVATRYREQGKRIFIEIENCSELAAEVRKTCNELSDKIAGSATTDKSKRKAK